MAGYKSKALRIGQCLLGLRYKLKYVYNVNLVALKSQAYFHVKSARLNCRQTTEVLIRRDTRFEEAPGWRVSGHLKTRIGRLSGRLPEAQADFRPQLNQHFTSKTLLNWSAFSRGGRNYRAEVRFNLLESSVVSNYLKCARARTIPAGDVNKDSLYDQAADTYGSSLDRLARAYEFDAEVRRDLLQEIHFQLWRSFAHFDGRCSLRTWVYRVAHNVATGHVIRQRRTRDKLVSIETIEAMPNNGDQDELAASHADALDRLSMLIQRLKPLDRQIIVSYLEGMDAVSIGELTGLSPGNIAMKVHRIKNVLKRWFAEGGVHAR